MADNGSLNFDDIVPYEEEFSYGGKRYVLTEASGDAAVRWQNGVFKGTTRTPEGAVVPGPALADLEPQLVAACLYEVAEKGRVRVAEQAVRAMPNRVQKRLFAKIMEVSDLKPKEEPKALEARAEKLRAELREVEAARAAEEAEKNGQAASPAG